MVSGEIIVIEAFIRHASVHNVGTCRVVSCRVVSCRVVSCRVVLQQAVKAVISATLLRTSVVYPPYVLRQVLLTAGYRTSSICFSRSASLANSQSRYLLTHFCAEWHHTIRVIELRIMRLARYVARMGERRGAYRILVRKSEWNRPLARSWCRWEDNIKINLQEVG